MKKYLIRDLILYSIILICFGFVIIYSNDIFAEENPYLIDSTDSFDGTPNKYIKSMDGKYIYNGWAQNGSSSGAQIVTATGFVNQTDLLKNDNYSTKIIGGYMHFGQYNTWSEGANKSVRHIMCAHSGAGESYKYGKIEEIIDIGYSSKDNKNIKIESPSYVYSHKNKSLRNSNAKLTILQYLALQSYRTESDTDRVIVSYAMQDIINKLHQSEILDKDIYNFSVYNGGTFDKKNNNNKYCNLSWISYIYGESVKNRGYYYNLDIGKRNTEIYENIKNIYDSENSSNKFSTSKILTSKKETSGDANVQDASKKIVGPIKVILPSLEKYDGQTDDFGKIEIQDTNNSNNKGTLCDINGNNITKINSNEDFYIKFSNTIPDEIKIILEYKQFYGKIIFSHGGNGQPEIMLRGGKGTNSSFVTYKIRKNADIIVNNSIMWSISDKEGTKTYKGDKDYNRNEYSENDKKENPVYVETGDIVKGRVRISNKFSNGIISRFYLDFANNVQKATVDDIKSKKPSQSYINEFLSGVPDNSVRNFFIEKRFDSNSEYKSANANNRLLSNINVDTSGYYNYYMMYVNGAQTSSASDVFDTKAEVKKEDVSPDEEDTSNNISYDYMKLKSINANITKTYDKRLKKEGNSYIEQTTKRASDDTPLLEYGDYVQYKIEVSNPGDSQDTCSNLYDISFKEEVPEGLKLVKVEKNNTSILTTSKLNLANENGYIEFSDNIKVGNKVTYYFIYLVETYGDDSKENSYQSITNTANIEKFHNRNGIEYINNKSSSAKIYIRNYGVRIDKYLYQNTYGSDGNKTTENITDRKGKTDEEKRNNPYYSEYGDILTYRFEIANTGSADMYEYCMQDVYNPKEFRFIEPKEIVIENGVEVKKDWSGTAKVIPTYIDDTLYYFWAGSKKKTLAPGETFVFELKFEVINQNTSNSNESLLLEDSFELTRITSSNNTIIFTDEDGYKVNTGSTGVDEYQDGSSQNHLIITSQIVSKEFTIERFYNVTTSKYLSGYDGKMMYENAKNNLITLKDEEEEYYEGEIEQFGINRRFLSEEEKRDKPFAVEKSETVTYTIKVENTKSENESNNTKTYISNIMDYLDFGLTKDIDSFEVKLKKNGKFKDFVKNSDYGISDIDKYTDSFIIVFPNEVELLPGDYIEINYKVKITRSNMALEILENKAILTEVTNRNNQVIIKQEASNTPIIDTGLNITPTISVELVKLKELVISGYIWEDLNKNGLKDDNEPGIEGIEVTLNGLNEDSKENKYTTVYTNSDGLYTFGRVFRTNENNEYEDSLYISYNYDGVKYQNTVYSGKDNLVYADGAYHMKPDYKIDSNAREFNYSEDVLGRIDFNNSLKTIYYNYGSEDFVPTENDIKLNYNKQDSVSTRNPNITEENMALIKSYSFVNYNDNNEEQIDYLWFNNPKDMEYETEYLKYINLGLILRDELDLSISEELDSITNTIFGDKFTYKYSQDNEAEFKYYSSDYYYKYSDYNDEIIRQYLTDESELTSQIKYKVKIKNEGISNDNVIVQVNELALYLDNKYTIQTNEDGKISSIIMKVLNQDELFEDEEISLVDAYFIDNSGNKIYLDVYKDSIYYPLENEHNGYTPLYIRTKESDDLTGIIIENGGYTDLYLTFVECKRSDEYDKYIDLGIYNHAIEISSYSTYYKDYADSYENKSKDLEQPGKGAGYIDIDSNPGNLGLGTYDYSDFFGEEFIKYDEDDTCRGSIRLHTYTGTGSGTGSGGGSGSGSGTGSGGGSGSGSGTGSGGGTGSGSGTGTGGGDPTEEPLEREITGIVFDDCRSESVQDQDGSNIQYIGNGLYVTTDKKADQARMNSNSKLSGKEENDSLVNGVTAELYQTIKIPIEFEDGTIQTRYYEINLNDVKQYNIPIYNSNEENYVSKVTDKSGYGDNKNEGEYKLSGFTPGTHFVRFSYGNNQEDENMLIFNGQDYKSTSMANYQEDIERGILTYRDLQNEENYQSNQYENKDKIKKYIENIQGSKAIDDPQRRLEVNLYSGEINNEKSEILRSGYEITSENLDDTSTSKNTMYELLSSVFVENTNMFADSIEFYVRTEDEYFINENQDYIDWVEYKNRKSYLLENLSFGLQYRPETELTEYEYVKEIIIEASTDKDFLHLYFTEDKKLDETKDNKGLSNVQQIDSTVNFSNEKGRYDFTKGFKFVNVDEQFLQGATLYVIYGIYVDNTGEVDRVGKSLYENGTDNFEDITRSELIDNIKKAIESYDIDYYDFYGTNTETSIYDDNWVGQTIRNYVFNYDSNIENNTYKDIYDWYIRSMNTTSRTSGLIGEFDLIYSSMRNDAEYYRAFEKYKNLLETLNPNAYENTTLYKFVEHITSANRSNLDGYFNVSTLIEELKLDFAKYDKLKQELNKNKEHLYRTNKKSYDDYYCKYLGTTYYGIEVTQEDKIATVKIDQIINNIDSQMQFDSTKYVQDWDSNSDITSLKNAGSYFFIEDYNLGDSELIEEKIRNIFMMDIKRYFEVYDSLENLVVDGKFTAEGKIWYKSLLSSLIETLDKYSYLEQGINNHMMTLATASIDYYGNKYGSEYINEASNFLSNITSDISMYKRNPNEFDDFDDISQFLNDEYAYNRFIGYINSISSFITAQKKLEDSENTSFKWKVIQSQLIEENNSNEYNTTYKFIKPKQNSTNSVGSKKEYTLLSEENTRVTLDIVTQVTISSDIFEHTDLSFDNISQVSKFFSVAGRKTIQESSPGNGDQHDITSDASVEHVTFTPPTGLSENDQKIEKTRIGFIITTIIGITILVISGFIYKFKSNKKLKLDKKVKR